MHVSGILRSRLVRFCEATLPDEGCGLLAGTPERVFKLYPSRNGLCSEHRFEVTTKEIYDATVDADRYGWRLLGAWHSHPTGPPHLSAVDVEHAPDVPGWLHVIVGFSTDDPPTVRAFTVDVVGAVGEVEL